MALRTCTPALATALSNGTRLYYFDLYTIAVQSGGTGFLFTSAPYDQVVGGVTFHGGPQFFKRGPWDVANTMTVGTLEVTIFDNTTTAFSGGTLTFKQQALNGFFDGGTLRLDRLFVTQANPTDTTTLGTIGLFQGDIGTITMKGASALMKVRSKIGRLSVNAPRNVYQQSCRHTFCDSGCTLNPASFTSSFTVSGTSFRDQLFITGGTLTAQTKGGTLKMTSGANNGLSSSIIDYDGFNTILLAYPLPFAPLVGDTCTVFLACDKRLPTCKLYNNKANFGGFPFIPPPATTAPNQ